MIKIRPVLLAIVVLTIILMSCDTEEGEIKDISKPNVITNKCTEFTSTTALITGETIENSSLSITDKGFIFGEGYHLTTSSLVINVGHGPGEYQYLITGLKPNSKYTFCAYASNENGRSVGIQYGFTTNEGPPDISLPTVQVNSDGTVDVECTIICDNGYDVLERGVCWELTPNFTGYFNVNYEGYGGEGAFNIDLTPYMQPQTKYYIRGFAETLFGGRTMGGIVSFNTN